MRQTYKTSPYPLDAGSLGFLEGLTLTPTPTPTASSSSSNSNSNKAPSIHYFGGIPYALPPIGPYRFRRPRPLPPCYRYGTRASPARFTAGTAVCPQPPWRGKAQYDLFDENCLQLNVYIPAGEAPRGGWPVFFYVHGGFLQWGDPNMSPSGLSPLLSETEFKCIIVQPAYRLNVFGFLASRELQAEAERQGQCAGNMGFWDQRAALEWTWKNIALFGGNHDNITIGGYSAGSHSTYQQLAHELYFVPDHKAIIKRAVMWSNSPGVQPKGLPEQQHQFDELLSALGISLSLSSEEKLKRLRAVPATKLAATTDKLKISEFRATTDNAFISANIISHINSGDFASRMKRRGISLMNGECRDEHNLYRDWRTPTQQSYEAVRTRLCADYPVRVVDKLLSHYCGSSRALPPGMKDWKDFYGRAYANMQVHCLERGFHSALVHSGGLQPGKDLLRYRLDWRAKCVDTFLPPDWGVTHATDMAIWFWGLDYGDGLSEGEKKILKPWMDAFAAFVKGERVEWGTSGVRQMRRLRADGATDVWEDERWSEGVEVWALVNGGESEPVKALL